MSARNPICCHGRTYDECDGTCTDLTRCKPPVNAPPIHMLVRDRQSFVLGMEFAMRIVRNRITDLKERGAPEDLKMECENMFGMIRIVQVQIGSGRMALPSVWTPDEIDEVGRIA
jgi:hypothetical protein